MNVTHTTRPGKRARNAQQRRDSLDLWAVGKEVRAIAAAILEQAVKDLELASLHIRLAAYDFIMGRDFAYWADMIDLDVQAARDALKSRLEAAREGYDGGADEVGPGDDREAEGEDLG